MSNPYCFHSSRYMITIEFSKSYYRRAQTIVRYASAATSSNTTWPQEKRFWPLRIQNHESLDIVSTVVLILRREFLRLLHSLCIGAALDNRYAQEGRHRTN